MAIEQGAHSLSLRDAPDTLRYNDLTALMRVTAAGTLHPKIRHAVRFIDRNYRNKLTLHSVADRIAFHPNYLCRRFHEELGMSFSEYLMRARLKHAIAGLIYTDDPIKEVAFRAGFAGPERFARVFRHWLQCSPRAFRARYRYGELKAQPTCQKR